MSTTQSFYTTNERGWRQYDVEKLLEKQCPIAEKNCKEEASYERYKAIGISSGAVLGAGVVVYTAFAIAKALVPLLVGFMTTIGVISGVPMPAAIFFATKVLTVGLTYTFTLIVLKKLWDASTQAVKNHWDHAAHLVSQALNIQLHGATFENKQPAAPIENEPQVAAPKNEPLAVPPENDPPVVPLENDPPEE
ncbi:MAG: hypothetical protein KR126chlam3_00904 [Chlamydiae bacterium]|nr:hypothetical protein [Chlamydiota bacterium]